MKYKILLLMFNLIGGCKSDDVDPYVRSSAEFDNEKIVEI